MTNDTKSKNSTAGLASIWPQIRDFFLSISGLLSFVLAIWFMYLGKVQEGMALLSAGFTLYVLSNLSRFEFFKVFGIEAKIKAIDQKIDELEEIRKGMRNIVGTSADVAFQMMGRINRWDASIPREEARAIAARFKKQLLELGENKETIDQMMAPWHWSNMRDLMEPVHQAFSDQHQLENQRVAELTRSQISIDASLDSTQMAMSTRAEKNKQFLELVNANWCGDMENFIRNVDSILEVTPFESELEKAQFKTKVQPSIEDAKYYLEHKDFRCGV